MTLSCSLLLMLSSVSRHKSVMLVISCDTNPTARSEKAIRLRNSFLTLAGIDKALTKARITKRFPRLVARKNATCETQKEKKIVLR